MTGTKQAARDAYYLRIGQEHVGALWNVLGALVTPEPVSACRPHLWRYERIRALLLEAGELITAREAERRVLVLENPGLAGQSRTTTSLYAGVQLVMPGEVAPAHRHSQSALRFILEGSGGHTTVDGERIPMAPGDLVITPGMTWHDHGNPSDDPVFWLDGLDIPLVSFLDASFSEHGTTEAQAVATPPGDSLARYGSDLLPVDYRPARARTPLCHFPYSRTRDALERMRRRAEWDPCHGLKLRYANPATGDHVMPTVGAFIQLLPAGFRTASYRSTDAAVFCGVEGSGRSTIGDVEVTWARGDIFVVPSWWRVSHEAAEDAVLFSCSDRPVQEKLDLFREDRANLPLA